ncbi:MAG: hypothetical protein WA303_02430, partial [Bradyrhizobium sp.]
FHIPSMLAQFYLNGLILRDASLRDAPQDEVLDPHGEERTSRVSNHEANSNDSSEPDNACGPIFAS